MRQHMTILYQHSSLFSSFICSLPRFVFFFFNDTATTEIYTLSLHDALPILWCAIFDGRPASRIDVQLVTRRALGTKASTTDRKSTRLNSSHQIISYAVFCLKKKNDIQNTGRQLRRRS